MPQRGRRSPYWMPPETITIDISKPSLLIRESPRRIRVVSLPSGNLRSSQSFDRVTERHDMASCGSYLGERSERWIAANAPRLESGYYSITPGFCAGCHYDGIGDSTDSQIAGRSRDHATVLGREYPDKIFEHQQSFWPQ